MGSCLQDRAGTWWRGTEERTFEIDGCLNKLLYPRPTVNRAGRRVGCPRLAGVRSCAVSRQISCQLATNGRRAEPAEGSSSREHHGKEGETHATWPSSSKNRGRRQKRAAPESWDQLGFASSAALPAIPLTLERRSNSAHWESDLFPLDN